MRGWAPKVKVALALAALLAAPALAAPLPQTPRPEAYRAAPFPTVLPAPREASYPAGTLPLEGLAVRLEGSAPELSWAARDLNAEVRVRLGRTLPATGTKTVRLGILENAALAAEARTRGLIPDKPEGYALWVDAGGAAVVGFDALGAYRGAQTLRQLLGPGGFRFAAVRDWPQFGTRMAMVYLDRFSQPVNDTLIPVLAKLKYSHLLVLSSYVQWDANRSAWHPSGATKAEARRVAALIRSYGMEPVPLIQTLSHVGWLFYNNQNKDLYQDPASRNPHAYDTLNPRTYQIVLPILTEAVDVFKPKFVHIGHDEVRNSAGERFPARENGIRVGFDKLFVDDTLKLYNHLKSLGVGTMIWQDEVVGTSKSVIQPQLPKDIVITDWHYSAAEDYPTIRDIQAAGFKAVGSPWYKPENAESFARSAAKDGAFGMLMTRWSGYFGNPSIFDGQAEQGVAYVNGAASFWNPGAGRPADPASSNYAARYRDGWRPASYAPIGGRLVDLSPAVTRRLADPDETQWVQKGPGIDLSNLPTGVQRFGAYEFNVSGAVMTKGSRAAASELPQSVTLEIGGRAAALAFLHTTGWNAPADRQKIGQYTLTYDDGSSVALPLEYGRHIASWTDVEHRSLFHDPVWRGKTKEDLEIGLSVYTWANPNPAKGIRSLTVASDGGVANPTLIGLTLLDAVPQEARP